MKRMLSAALAVCLALALALPCLAAPQSAVVTDARTAVDVSADGSAEITHEMDVTFAGKDEFRLDFYAGWSANGAQVSDIEAAGAPCEIEADTDNSFSVVVDASGLDSATLTVSYHYATFDDLEDSRDVMVVPLFAFSRSARVEHVTATVTFPESLAPTDVRVVESLYVANSRDDAMLEASVSTDGSVVTVETHETMNEWENLCLALEFEPGALGVREVGLGAGVRVTQSACDVEVSTQRVYTVRQSLTVEVDEDADSWTLFLPLLETEDCWDGCTYADFAFQRNDGDAEFEQSWDSVVFSLSDGWNQRSGAFTFEYTYTLTPRAFSDRETLYLPTVHGADTTENLTFTLRAPGLTDARTFLSAITATPKYERFDVEVKDGVLTVRTRGALYGDESLHITPEWDEAAFSRSASGAAAAALVPLAVLAAVCILLARRARRPRPAAPASPDVPQGVTCADAGYLCDGVVSTAELGALVVSWASRGAAAIGRTPDGDIVVTRLASPGEDAPDWEREFFEALFLLGGGSAFSARGIRGMARGASRAALAAVRAQYRSGPRALIDARSRRLSAALCALACVPAALAALTARLALGAPAFEALAAAGLALAACIPPAACAHIAARRLCWLAQSPQRVAARIALGVLAVLAAAAPAAVLAGAGISVWAAAVSALACVAVAALSGRVCAVGAGAFDVQCALSGLVSFLASASAKDIDALVAKDPNAFYALLPYAISMGLYQPWLDQFETAFTPVNTAFAGARSARDAAQLAAQTTLTLRSALF